MWWTKIPDDELIGMLEAIPPPWNEPTTRAWLRLVGRCCSEGRSYWMPDHASARMVARSQKCQPPGAVTVAKISGCSRNIAGRMVSTILHRQEQKSRKQAQGGHKQAQGVHKRYPTSRANVKSRLPTETMQTRVCAL